MKRIAVTGANGFVASAIRLYNQDRFEFINITRKEIDLTNPETVYPVLSGMDFDVLVHTAANAVTEFCAANPELAHKINVDSTIEAAKAAKDKHARFVFLSTEQIYNGKTEPGPFKESDEPLCVTNYGNYKLEGEKFINENLEDYLILRLSTMFGMAMPCIKPSANFLTRTWTAMRTKTPTKFTPNEKRGMTYVRHLSDRFADLIELPSGTYHVASKNELTTYEVCQYCAKQLGFSDEEIARYILPDHERYADRFRDYRLDGSKLKEYGIDLGTMEEDVDRCLKDFGWR
ncbi:MAG: sugar nucleotide-binding protein [Solobacterium sp.]|nr:sugar nucleotide-binding protein [Solobacterium sp.]